MDVLVLVIALTMGLLLTILGFRNSGIAIISVVFNVTVFVEMAVNGVTEVIGYADSAVVTTTYNATPLLLLPLSYIIFGIVKVAKYR